MPRSTAELVDALAVQFDAAWNEETVETTGAEAQESADTLNTFGRVVPAILGILGVISLAAGVFLGVRGGRARTA